MSFHYSPRIVTDGLVFCVDALAPSSYGGSGTTWTDLAGGNNMTLYNSPTFNSAGYFDFVGVTSGGGYTICNSALDLSTNWTIEVWMNADDWTYPASACGDKRASWWIQASGYWNLVTLQSNGSGLYFRGMYATSSYFTKYFTNEALNTWMHVVVTWQDNGYASGYINNVSGFTPQDVSAMSIDPTTTKFGLSYHSMHCGTARTNGQIAVARQYNRALTTDEISQNFNAQRGRFGI